MAILLSTIGKEVPDRRVTQSDWKDQVNTDTQEEPSTINEYEDAERNYDLRSPKFWSIIVGMYIVLFLVGLVVLPFRMTTQNHADLASGSKHCRSCHTHHHR